MINPDNLNRDAGETPEPLKVLAPEQEPRESFLGRYFDGGEESDIDKKVEALQKVEGGVSRLEKSNAREKSYLDQIAGSKRDLEHRKKDYKQETGLLSKAKDRILKKMGKDNKLSEMEKAEEELKAKEQRRLLRVEKARKLRAGLADNVGKTFESELDPLYQKVIERVVGDKIGPVLDLYKENLKSNNNEQAKEVELALGRFIYQYKQFTDKLAKISPDERDLVLSFINDSGLAYDNPSHVIQNIHEAEKKQSDDFGKGLIMVHKTDYIPHGRVETTAGTAKEVKDKSAGGKKTFTYNSARGTISFSINFPVVDHMEGTFSDRDYAILVPFSNVRDRVINAAEEDAFVVGDLPLENTGTELLISADKAKLLTAGRLKAIIKNSGAALIVIGKEGESINETVARRIQERGYSFMRAGQAGWEGINPEAHQLMHELSKRENKLFGLHACTAFGELEKYMQQWLTNAYVGAWTGSDGLGDPNFKERYLGKVDEYVSKMGDSIRKQGRELNEFELEALRKIRLAAAANCQETMSIAEEKAA